MAVICLKTYRETKKIETIATGYKAKINSLDRMELLTEMVRFQERKSSNDGAMSERTIEEGIILFEAIFNQCQTQELKTLSESYLRFLKYESKQRRENG